MYGFYFRLAKVNKILINPKLSRTFTLIFLQKSEKKAFISILFAIFAQNSNNLSKTNTCNESIQRQELRVGD